MDFNLETYEDELRFLVNIDSGSRCLEGVDQVTTWFGKRFEALGWSVEYIEPLPGEFGKSAFVHNGNPEAFDILILCHTDTVFPDGTAAARPFSKTDERYTGPGVADMKAGCLMALHSLEQLHQSGKLKGSVGIFFNGEHELSCPNTRSFIEEQSQKAKFVVTTEPARADGSCVIQRKGILRYTLTFHGRGAHSGVDPENGICAVTQMAKTILALKAFENPDKGINVNPGLVKGGVSINAIPSLAECKVDIRVTDLEDAYQIDVAVRKLILRPDDPRICIELLGGITRPPLIPNKRSEELADKIKQIGSSHGLAITWSFSGGGSDASFASAFCIPSLCGLGPVGGNYHTSREYLETVDLIPRMRTFRDTIEMVCNSQI
ncbi:Peptidase family M20/M25/M40 [Verrucomicrobiia bacterium DG1235]|nr:Peptidase family M20/M25/M40 [Verrucomicrobiae bacterium DG1235]